MSRAGTFSVQSCRGRVDGVRSLKSAVRRARAESSPRLGSPACSGAMVMRWGAGGADVVVACREKVCKRVGKYVGVAGFGRSKRRW